MARILVISTVEGQYEDQREAVQRVLLSDKDVDLDALRKEWEESHSTFEKWLQKHHGFVAVPFEQQVG